MGGFDTHSGQGATHPGLLSQLDGAVDGFFRTLDGHPKRHGVVLAVYSEFGRRLQANGSGGTDHGGGGHLLLFGTPVRNGLHGESDIGELLDGDLRATTDFRSVYGALLAGMLGADPAVSLGGSRSVPKMLDVIR